MLKRLIRARPWLRWTLGLTVFAAIVTTIDVAQAMAQFALQGMPPLSALRLWGLGWLEWLVRGSLIPVGVAASRQFPLDGAESRIRNATVHLLIGTLGPPLLIAVSIPAMIPQITGGIPGNPEGPLAVFTVVWLFLLSRYLLPTMAMYAVVVGVHHAWRYQNRYREAEARELRLEGMLDAARLAALRAQVRPHFLFNTLNAIAVLARKGEGQKVAETTTTLSEMLRLSLASEEQFVRLEDELRLVNSYLRIEGMRFEDRLAVRWCVEEEAGSLPVPALLLQPLVENAVVHGAARRRDRTTITIGVKRLDQRLHLWVEDDGPGMDPLGNGRRRSSGAGIGIGNTRERLEHLFGDEQALRIRTAPGDGFRVDVLLPLTERPTRRR